MKNVVIATLVSSILGLAMIGGALYWQSGSANGPAACREEEETGG